jgi:adenylylsulfate kinase
VPFVEVHVAAPVDVCARRDVKGLYARQAAGTLTGLTGVDAPYEVPPAPELRIRTDLYDEATCAARVLDALASSCPSGSTSGSWA